MNAPPVLTVAAGQATSVALDIAANVTTAARLVRRASEQGAELVVLPELFLTGHELTGITFEPARYTVAEDDSRLDPLADACAQTRTAAVVGAPTWEDGRIHSSALVIGRGGQPVGRYDKQHLGPAERAAGFSAGAHGHTVALDTWRIGIAIGVVAGTDVADTEHARAAARDGCQVYAVCGRSGGADVDAVLTDRAADNGLHTILADHRGTHRDGGRSGVWHPDGTRLAEAGTADPGLAVATVTRL